MSIPTHAKLDKAGVFLKSQILSAHEAHDKPGGSFVTISRESGAGAVSLASQLAERLSDDAESGERWTVYGAEIIVRMLEANHLSPHIAQYLLERRISEINGLIGEIVGLHPSLWDMATKTKLVMRELAERGNAIFVGRGAAFATAEIPGGVHIRLVASTEFRARRTAERLGISITEATAHNATVDAERRGYVKTNFDAQGPDPKAYDLVINTGTVPIPDAVGIIEALVRSRSPAARSSRVSHPPQT